MKKLCKKHGGKSSKSECFECRVLERVNGACNRMMGDLGL